MALKTYKIKLWYIALVPQHTETKLRLVAFEITLGYLQAKHQRCGKYKWEKLLIPDQWVKKKPWEENKCGNSTDYIVSCKEQLQEQTEVWQDNLIKPQTDLLREQDLLGQGKNPLWMQAGTGGCSFPPNPTRTVPCLWIMEGWDFGEISATTALPVGKYDNCCRHLYSGWFLVGNKYQREAPPN